MEYARATFGKRRSAAPPPDPVADEAPVVAPERRPAVRIAFLEPITATSLSQLAAKTAAAVAGGATEVDLLIASPGGELLPTLELHRLLTRLPVKLRTHAVGQVASAATVLMLAGSERSAAPAATFLFHEVSTQLRPPPGSFVARSIERHRQLYELTAHEVYRTRTRLPHDLIERFAMGEVILDAPRALEFGVIHRICDHIDVAENSPYFGDRPSSNAGSLP